MKVILLEDVKKWGKKNDIIDVKDGYGNFLISEKKALLATSNNVRTLNRNMAIDALEENLLIKDMESLKDKLSKVVLEFNLKANKDRVFGSISTKQIASKLKSLGYDIDKKQINLKDAITSLGYHEVEINLHKKVKATIKVQVLESK